MLPSFSSFCCSILGLRPEDLRASALTRASRVERVGDGGDGGGDGGDGDKYISKDMYTFR